DVAGESPVEISRLSDGAGLDRPADVAWSRDGGSLYVAGYCDHDIAILSATGTLSWVGSVYEADPLAVGCVWLSGQDETTGEDVGSDARLPNPVALEVSPDGKTLAVAGPSVGFDVLLYDLDEASGPSLRGYMDGRPTVDGVMEISNTPLSQLDDPTDLVLPPEHAWSVSLTSAGDHLYAASFWSDAWTAIDISANESAAQGFVQRGHNGVSWLLGAYNLELSPDDRHLYVAPRLVGTVKPFAVDATTGGLTELESPPEPVFGDEAGSVSNVHVAPDGSQVFAIDSLYAKLLVYDRDADTGLLTLRSHAPLPDCEGQPAFPVDVAVSPDGTHVFVADFQYGVSCMDVFPRQDGGVGEPLQLAESVLEGIENFVFSADARHVYAACLGGTVAHYLRDDQGGLTAQPTVEIDALVGAEFTVMSPDERWLYVASPVADKVIVFSRALETGTLTLHQIVNDSNQGSRLEGAAGLAITPDGRHLYVTARIHDAINHFSVGTDGKLSLEAVVQGQPGQEWVNGLAMRSDGAMLYSSAVDAHAVMAWRVIRGDQDGCLGICPTQ
ncbi:MAG: 6-phosphogluconolactonase (cycloisomerase 2 family), partial [Myxococcota bacterium]